MRLRPCLSCGRHVRANDARCPFCGAGSTSATPTWLSTLLLGLAVAGCDPKPEPSKKAEPEKAEPATPEPAGTTSTSGAIEPASTAGTGAGVTTEPVVEDPRPAEKYGAPPLPDTGLEAIEPEPVVEEPRPAKKYGAPPKPDDDEPRPAPKYGGPPMPG